MLDANSLSRMTIAQKYEELGRREDQRQAAGWSQVGKRPENARRNRYTDVIPWDRTRVFLPVDSNENNYINASHVKLDVLEECPVRNYIVSQGPTRETIPDFWHMIYAYTKSQSVITMLTELSEGFREKCALYWPTSIDTPLIAEDTEKSLPPLAVSLLEVETDPEGIFEQRKFMIGPESKIVYHILYKGWRDHAGPEEHHDMYQLCTKVHSLNDGVSPVFVHCSAGIGRSGTFIALDYAFSAGSALSSTDRSDPVFDIVDAMRQQRPGMVQKLTQFKYIYDTLGKHGNCD